MEITIGAHTTDVGQPIAIGRQATAVGQPIAIVHQATDVGQPIAIGHQATAVGQGQAVIGMADPPTNPRAKAICIGTCTVAYEGEIVIGTEEYTSVRIGGIDLVDLLETNKRLCERIDVLECHVNALMEASTLDD